MCKTDNANHNKEIMKIDELTYDLRRGCVHNTDARVMCILTIIYFYMN